MSRILLLSLVLCAACDIRNDRPGFEYPASSDASGPDWPELAVTEDLLAESAQLSDETAQREEEAERLAARARVLKARAARLRAAQ